MGGRAGGRVGRGSGSSVHYPVQSLTLVNLFDNPLPELRPTFLARRTYLLAVLGHVAAYTKKEEKKNVEQEKMVECWPVICFRQPFLAKKRLGVPAVNRVTL